ncbi:dicarboxylate/amino acid:cation symporter [Parasutterella secunda]|uniref:Dicarboxylate/amino acid:cation symporter n=1 Tax=Parasutterella secunda TaxID=626947 RepID=A0ABS2GTW4_9BURK|nr:dicarboxylate/amino acid:cation symporter [Parasutterella secunda]MBM6928287.1 dicarboxylate/amino acid:cation symporter [Parasutterella secunda]
MAKSKSASMGLAMQMLIGLVLGVIVGMFLDSQFATTYVKPFGDLFIRLIRMVVVPLVFATLVAGAAGISDVSKLGRVAIKTLVIFMLTSAIAVIFGLLIANIIDPGIGLTLSTEGLKAAQVKAPSFVQTLLDIVPINPMEAFAKGSILQIIFFAIMFGFCLNFLGEKGRPVYHFFDIVGNLMIHMTQVVMRYAPIGVFALMAVVVSQHGLAVLLPLGKLILASFIATALLVILIYIPIVMFIIRIPVADYFKGIFEPWLIAFTTCSSAAAMAANLVASRRLGATNSIASFAVPLGNTINMNGTAVYMGVCAVFAAQIYDLPLTMGDQVIVVITGVLAAVGTAGVPGAGLIMSTLVFTQIGIPLEVIALIAGVDRVLDMIRTSINVVGDSTTALMVSRMEGELGSEPFNEDEGK